MGTSYTGVAAHVSLAAPVTITVPADGDADAAATFDVGMQALADFMEAIRSQYSPSSGGIFGILQFVGLAPNTASTISNMWNSGGEAAASPVMSTGGAVEAQSFWMVPAACVLKQITYSHGASATAGGTINLVVHKVSGGAGGVLTTLATITVAAGNAANTPVTVAINAALVAGNSIYVTHETQAGVTNGGGGWLVSAQITTS